MAPIIRQRFEDTGDRLSTAVKGINMPQTKQLTLAKMKLGIFVIIAFFLLSALILQQSWGINWFSSSAKIITYLPDVGGLKPGSPVWLAGMEIGKVRKVSIVSPDVYTGNASVFDKIEDIKKQIQAVNPNNSSGRKIVSVFLNDIRDLKLHIRIVEVQLDIRTQYINKIDPDSEVSIDSKGLIGDSFIDISPGTTGKFPPRKGEFYIIESIQQPGFREIMTGANDVIANFGVLSERVQNIAAKIEPDRIGSEIFDTVESLKQTIRQANETFSQATILIKELHSGQGTFGKIVNDPEVYVRLTESLEKFSVIAQNIQSGSGTLAKLINDPALYNSASSTLNNADKIMQRIEKGEGTLGKLSTDEALYERSKRALESFSSLVEQIDKGEGTMGKLLKDPGLYDNIEQSSSEISKLLYDLRQDPKKYLTIRFRLF
jgi:phospholipid/cholesterol/gamma-HCH transport system substrate-binding protein